MVYTSETLSLYLSVPLLDSNTTNSAETLLLCPSEPLIQSMQHHQ